MQVVLKKWGILLGIFGVIYLEVMLQKEQQSLGTSSHFQA